jgi:serine/threonine protein kinase
MYCPKCKENFEEGSRRFCPVDGSRLVPENAGGDQWEGGIFANLVSTPESKASGSDLLQEVHKFVVTEPAQRPPEPEPEESGDFFILEDIEPDAPVDPILAEPFEFEPRHSDVRPAARKIDPNDIPAGHVELDEGDDRLAFSSADFRADDPEAFIGRMVKGRYLVTDYFGGDESGYAFLADDKIVPDRKVLVRILLRGETDEIMGSMLDEERVSLSHFTHPNIARLIDSGQFTDGTRFLVSEYVDALSVADILSIHGAFDPQRAARVIKQAAYALNEAHQEGILHRDLRPANLIVSPGDGDGEQVTLVNFGASTGEPTDLTMGYKAPEVIDGRVPTSSSDVFSLAVVAFEMLTGRLPFSAKSANDLMRSQHDGPVDLPSNLRRGLPRTVDFVLEKALSFKVAERYVKSRDFGDAFYTALVDADASPIDFRKTLPDEELPTTDTLPDEEKTTADAAAIASEKPAPSPVEPAWKMRSPEPPKEETARAKVVGGVGLLALLALLAVGWYYVVKHPAEPELPANVNLSTNAAPVSTIVTDTEMPPQPRNIPQPPNTSFYQNSKQNLRGDLLRNFVGFTMYYPKDWKVNGPQPSETATGRGKFIDISRETPDGRMKEQMLISYYPSKGTFNLDSDKFPQLIKEANETLKKLLPGYQMVSESEIKLNGDWRAYELKFQGGGTSPSGEKLIVWGRRLYIPAARPGVRNGFEITMLATSLADEVRSVDDVGVRGELAQVLYSFEPSQNF